MSEKDEDMILGGALRAGYEILKANLKTEKNESFFGFVESLGKEVRGAYEEDFKDMYNGADIVKKGKDFWDSLKKIIK